MPFRRTPLTLLGNHLIITLMDLLFRFSKKIRQLNEGGLINYWIEKELDKVARKSLGGSDKKRNVLLYKTCITFRLHNQACEKSDPL